MTENDSLDPLSALGILPGKEPWVEVNTFGPSGDAAASPVLGMLTQPV
jgi:hypothetical protein